MQGDPLPESSVGLFITLCTEWILKQHVRTYLFAQQSQIVKLHGLTYIWGHPQKWSYDKINFIYNIWGNPFPESYVGLCIALCNEWILKKHIRTHVFAQRSKQSENTRPGFHLGAHKQRKLWQNQFHIKDAGKCSSRQLRWMIYYTLHISSNQKHTKTCFCTAKHTNKNCKQIPYIFPPNSRSTTL